MSVNLDLALQQSRRWLRWNSPVPAGFVAADKWLAVDGQAAVIIVVLVRRPAAVPGRTAAPISARWMNRTGRCGSVTLILGLSLGSRAGCRNALPAGQAIRDTLALAGVVRSSL
ncbi:MAG: hypothetical protein R3C44_20680 [Chloroflexota bacterium]